MLSQGCTGLSTRHTSSPSPGATTSTLTVSGVPPTCQPKRRQRRRAKKPPDDEEGYDSADDWADQLSFAAEVADMASGEYYCDSDDD